MVKQETGSHRSSTAAAAAAALKLLCSYGGIILPRRPDGRLRYVGGLTRILAVDRSVSYAGALGPLLPPPFLFRVLVFLGRCLVSETREYICGWLQS